MSVILGRLHSMSALLAYEYGLLYVGTIAVTARSKFPSKSIYFPCFNFTFKIHIVPNP